MENIDIHSNKKSTRSVLGGARSIGNRTAQFRRNAFQRFPFLMISLSTFGLVAVLYSFERLIALIPVLNNNPLFIFLLGIAALATTGSLYKKLQ